MGLEAAAALPALRRLAAHRCRLRAPPAPRAPRLEALGLTGNPRMRDAPAAFARWELSALEHLSLSRCGLDAAGLAAAGRRAASRLRSLDASHGAALARGVLAWPAIAEPLREQGDAAGMETAMALFERPLPAGGENLPLAAVADARAGRAGLAAGAWRANVHRY